MARELASQGRTVYAIARRQDRLEALAAEHNTIIPYAVDLTDEHAVDELAGRIGPIDAIVHAAGGARGSAPVLSADTSHWQWMWQTNVLGTMYLLRRLAPRLAEQGHGAIVVVTSAAALQWALLAGYAMRMVEPAKQGRALSIAMGGIPLALAVGVPLGTFLGEIFDWRGVFLAVTIVGAGIACVGAWILPSVGGESSSPGAPWKAFQLPGILIVLIGAGAFQLGHMNLYTYVAPFLEQHGNPLLLSAFLLTLGVAAIVGLFLTGLVIDRYLRLVALSAMTAFAVGMLLLATLDVVPVLIAAAVVWGLGLGASPTIYQTACARVAGPLVDQAQSLLVTIFNAGMALGSGIGGRSSPRAPLRQFSHG